MRDMEEYQRELARMLEEGEAKTREDVRHVQERLEKLRRHT